MFSHYSKQIFFIILTVALSGSAIFAQTSSFTYQGQLNNGGTPVISVFSQSGGAFDLRRNVIAGGGNTSSSGNLRLSGTIGQSAAGSQMSGGGFKQAGGFWTSTGVLAATTTTLVSSVNPSDVGQEVTFTATVTTNAGRPTGTIQFTDFGENLGSPVAVNANGQGTFSTFALQGGTHTVTAEYSGDANFEASSGTLLNPQVVRPKPLISVGKASISEGDNGTRTADIIVSIPTASNLPVSVDYETADQTATSPTDYLSASGTLTLAPGETSKAISLTINGDQTVESDEIFVINFSHAVNAINTEGQGVVRILNDDAQGSSSTFGFAAASYQVAESGRLLTITVTRSGDTSTAATVDYATNDDSDPWFQVSCGAPSGVANSRCDFTTAAGTLKFVPGETTKTFDVLISQDSYVEGPETFPITLANPTGGGVLGTQSSVNVTIIDDQVEPVTNPIDDPDNFARQHYHDFLNREGDPQGQSFWTSKTADCGDDPGCLRQQRINVSAAFLSSRNFSKPASMSIALSKAHWAADRVTWSSSLTAASCRLIPIWTLRRSATLWRSCGAPYSLNCTRPQ